VAAGNGDEVIADAAHAARAKTAMSHYWAAIRQLQKQQKLTLEQARKAYKKSEK
jgi:TfoX/Sxy family transcriptional regulator of competence genes